ncbi:MAG: DUF3467 domain-containing protein [Chthoniobacteraceae bacterium]|jgi:hypothetical protein
MPDTTDKPLEPMPDAPVEASKLAEASTLTLAYDESSHATYSNLCRVTGTPEEVMMDFALNPNAFGRVVDETVKIDHRIVMSYEAAKRTAFVLLETIRRHEERFGPVELDPRKRLRGHKEGG